MVFLPVSINFKIFIKVHVLLKIKNKIFLTVQYNHISKNNGKIVFIIIKVFNQQITNKYLNMIKNCQI